MRAITALFEQRVRGFRLIELIGLGLALAMIFLVCLSKAREGEDIKHMNQLDQQIADESAAVDALKIRVAQLERPSRLEALAKAYLNMKPVEAAHEAQIDSLSEISHTTSRPVAVAAPVVAQAPADPLISGGVKTTPAVAAVSAAPLKPGAVR
jgi:hypothetical protein